MATRPTSSTLAAWELGIRLRRSRIALGPTAASVAKKIDIAAPNFSAIEAGKRRITTSKLTALCELYELDEADHESLQSLRAAAEQRNWWHDYGELYGEEFLRFLGLEAGASRIREWAPTLIPGLLQTADYARATIRAGSPYIKPVDVGPRLETRLARQTLLSDEPKLRMDVLFGEAALRQQVGGEAMLRQLDHLVEIGGDIAGAVNLRVVPYGAGAHPLIGAPLTLITFDNPLLTDLVWQETAITGRLIEKAQIILECTASFANVFESVALSAESSLELIQQIRRELETTA